MRGLVVTVLPEIWEVNGEGIDSDSEGGAEIQP